MKKALLFITSLFMLALCSCSNEYNEDFAKQTMLKETTSQNLIEFIFEGKKYSTTYTKAGDSLICDNKEASEILNAVKYTNDYSIAFNEDGIVIEDKNSVTTRAVRRDRVDRAGNPIFINNEVKPILGVVILCDSKGGSKIFTTTGKEGIVEDAVDMYGWGGKRVTSFRILNLTEEPWIFDYYSSPIFFTGKVKVEIAPSSVNDVVRAAIQKSNGGSVDGALLAYLTSEWNRLTHSPFESFRYLPKNGWSEVKKSENSVGRTTGGRTSSR